MKVTQIYAKITKEKISQDVEILSHKLESLGKPIIKYFCYTGNRYGGNKAMLYQ